MTKITKQGWEKAREKWTKALDKTRRKVKWNYNSRVFTRLTGWKGLNILGECSYCLALDFTCENCPLYRKELCFKDVTASLIFYKYVKQMQAPRTNWKLAIQYCQQMLTAIEDDGREWGYLK